MPSVAAMLGTTTPTPNAQMLQALLTASLAGQQQQVASDETYQIKCNAAEYAQLQAATLAQRTNAEQAQAKTMAVQIAKVVRETVDARYEEAQQTLKQLKPQYLPDYDKSSSTEVGSPSKLTPKKRSRANKKQRMASQLLEQGRKIAELQSRLGDEDKTDKTASTKASRGHWLFLG